MQWKCGSDTIVCNHYSMYLVMWGVIIEKTLNLADVNSMDTESKRNVEIWKEMN